MIRGLAETLGRDRPTVMFEVSKAVLKSPDSIRACFSLFPDDYAFYRLSGQTSWPVQRKVAKTAPMDVRHQKARRKSCDVVCFGRESNRL